MTTLKKTIISLVVALILTVGAVFGFKHEPQIQTALGATAGGTVSPNGTVLANPSNFTFIESSQASEADSQFILGGATVATGITQAPSIGSCASATSTLAVIANPFAATSTAQVVMLVGTGQATTTTFSVGTTTKSSGLALADISPSLVNGAVAATTTQFVLYSGGVSDLGSGQITSGSNTIGRVLVGPNENVAIFGTSTATGAGAANYTSGFSCLYKIRWEI